MLRFMFNGIKGSDGVLQKCYYSAGELINFPAGTITIYARDYKRFSPEVAREFEIENTSDMMTDYFEDDRIRVQPSHPLYPKVLEGLDKLKAHNLKARKH